MKKEPLPLLSKKLLLDFCLYSCVEGGNDGNQFDLMLERPQSILFKSFSLEINKKSRNRVQEFEL